jgi:lipid-A-disaccharide synthase
MCEAATLPTTVSAAPRVFLVAAEESGDRLGAALIGALRERTGGTIAISGVGGRDMARAGVPSPFPIDDLAIVGFSALPRRLPLIVRRIKETADLVIRAKPDVLVIIDSPDFTHRVAKKVRAADPTIPIVDYVCPSVWAWRPWRARSMRRYVDRVLALLPFEPAILQKLGGPSCAFVGHPLTERIATLRPNADETRRRMSDPPVVLLLPGSRGSEIKRMLPVFGDAIAILERQTGPLEITLPTVPHLRDRVEAAIANWPRKPRIVVDQQEKYAAFRIARAALAKSGTVTLELALSGVPTIAGYRVSLAEEIVARLMINVPTIILANLVIGENVVPELLQRDCTAGHLAQALGPLLSNSPERRRQIEAFGRLDSIMEIGKRTPAFGAADGVLAMLSSPGPAFAGKAPKL